MHFSAAPEMHLLNAGFIGNSQGISGPWRLEYGNLICKIPTKIQSLAGSLLSSISEFKTKNVHKAQGKTMNKTIPIFIAIIFFHFFHINSQETSEEYILDYNKVKTTIEKGTLEEKYVLVKYISESFVSETFEKKSLNDFNQIILFCKKYVIEFEWKKHIPKSSSQIKNISQKENELLENGLIALDIIAKASILKNKEAISSLKEINEFANQNSIPQLVTICNEILRTNRENFIEYEVSKMINEDLEMQKIYIHKFLTEKDLWENEKYLSYFLAITQKPKIIDELKKDQIFLSHAKNGIEINFSLKQKKTKNLAIKQAFLIKFFLSLFSEEENIAWLKKIKQIQDLPVRTRKKIEYEISLR